MEISHLEKRIASLEKKALYFTGIGFDSHKFCVRKKDIILGGVKIPFDCGFDSHSDGDVLFHALIDALLGASGLPDIGTLFPDDDPQYKGIDSRILLLDVMERLKGFDLKIWNMDAVIIAQKPKLTTYIPQIKKNIAPILELSERQIGIKAKTAEGMGFIGEGMGIAVFSTVLLTVI